MNTHHPSLCQGYTCMSEEDSTHSRRRELRHFSLTIIFLHILSLNDFSVVEANWDLLVNYH